jgi:hypothetical protein
MSAAVLQSGEINTDSLYTLEEIQSRSAPLCRWRAWRMGAAIEIAGQYHSPLAIGN